MKNNFDVTETVSYNADEIRRANICEVLKHVSKALDERGYNSINQLAGYLISNVPIFQVIIMPEVSFSQ